MEENSKKSFEEYLFSKETWIVGTIALFYYGLQKNPDANIADLIIMAFTCVIIPPVASFVYLPISLFFEMIFGTKESRRTFLFAGVVIFGPAILVSFFPGDFMYIVAAIYYVLLFGAWVKMQSGWEGVVVAIIQLAFLLFIISIL